MSTTSTRFAKQWLLVLMVVATSASGALGQPNRRDRSGACDSRQLPAQPDLAAAVSSVTATGSAAERLTTYEVAAAGIATGTIAVCARNGRVELQTTQDDRIRIQVRIGASGEGARNPPAAARRAIEQTTVRVYSFVEGNRPTVLITNDALGFAESAGSATIAVTIGVPSTAAYDVNVEVLRGAVVVRDVALAAGSVRVREAQPNIGARSTSTTFAFAVTWPS